MKVLICGDSPTVSTGFARCTRVACNSLLAAGHEVIVLGISEFGDPRLVTEYPYPIYPCVQPIDNGHDVLGVTRLPTLVDRLKPSLIILINDPWNIPAYMDQLKITKGICDKLGAEFTIPPVIAWLAVDSVNHKGELLNSLAHVITWTNFAANELSRGGCTVPMSVVPLGVDRDVFYPRDQAASRRMVCSALPDNAFVVGVVGRNQPRKRLDLTLKYFANWIHSYGIDNAYLFLYVAPTGETGCDITQLVKYYNLTGKVMSHTSPIGKGHSDELLAHVYSAFDVYLSTSQAEGWGLPALEAMSCGVPCVLPDFASFGPEGWTGDTACAISCFTTSLTAPLNGNPYTIGGIPDERSTINALSLLYKDDKARHTLSLNGRLLASTLTWANTERKFRRAIETVIGDMEAKESMSSDSDNESPLTLAASSTVTAPAP